MANPPAAMGFASVQPSPMLQVDSHQDIALAMPQVDSYQGIALAMPQSSDIRRPFRGCTT
jgi:hypothetical protein